MIASKTGLTLRMLAIDGLLLAVVCILPSLSHSFALPMYKLNPMALCLLAGMALTGDKRNGALLAVLLPLVSMLVTGMPAPLKCVCMMAELLTVVGAYALLSKRAGAFIAVLTALLFGKLVFYGLKALLFSGVALIGTSVWLQLAMVLLYSAAFALAVSKLQK